MYILPLGFRAFFSRLFGLTRQPAIITAPPKDYPLDPTEFANLIKRRRRQDFEKLAQMLSSRSLAPGRPAKLEPLRRTQIAGGRQGTGRHQAPES